VVGLKRVVVIGGNAAGMSAASQVKRQKPDWDVTVFEKGRFISYGACGIPYHVEGLVAGLDDLISVTPEEAVNERKLNLKMNHEVTAIDPQLKTVTVSADSGITTEPYDYLVIATGAQPLKRAVEYSPSKRVFTVHSLNDSETLRNLIETRKLKKCAVIGGGYIAVEMLEALKKQRLETHMIHRRDELSRTFEKEISGIALAEIAREGIVLNLNQSVSRVEEDGNLVKVHTDHGVLIYDLVIVAVGVEPNSDLAKNCGIKTGVKDSIKVDQYMRTNLLDIYAAGDCAETTDLVTGRPVYVPLALKANKEGVVAGINISGGNEAFPGVLGTAIMKFCDLGLARTGLTLAEAKAAGFEAIKYSVTSNSKAHYFPGGGKLTAVLTADKKTGRLLGAQLAGPVDGVKRIDTYATAISAEMTVNDIFQLDLAYAPPFSPVYDPVVLTGRVGRKKVDG
jgi:CoA-dependent NAD(P)H sulfur oxidoreductase